MRQLDEVYVVSDLHLGGVGPARQIFAQGARLARVIRHVAALPAGRKAALVLNGDTVDFLAEDGAVEFDPIGAHLKLRRILEQDPSFTEVTQALRELVGTPDRLLVLTLGNHDVELALPRVRDELVRILCGEAADRRGRLELALDGAGWTALVGPARVVCVHGNEVDAWNVVDHDALFRQVRASVQGELPPEWQTNAGTKMVVSVMNAIKRDFPLVDLLKPETKPVITVLLALDASFEAALRSAAGIASQRVVDSVRLGLGLLSAGDANVSAAPGGDPLEELLAGGQKATALPAEEEMLREAWGAGGAGGAGATEAPRDLLGKRGLLLDKFLKRDPKANLREALGGWVDESEFALDKQDQTFTRLDERVGHLVHFVVAGHTHLERARPRASGRGYYFNTGTWARLIELGDDWLGDATRFEVVWNAFRARSLQALDGVPALVKQKSTVVRIARTDQGAVGELFHAVDGAQLLEPVALPEPFLVNG